MTEQDEIKELLKLRTELLKSIKKDLNESRILYEKQCKKLDKDKNLSTIIFIIAIISGICSLFFSN